MHSSPIIFTGHDATQKNRAIAIAKALELYANTGMRVNRAYTPAAMMRAAREITGLTFKPRAYLSAASALKLWAYGADNPLPE